MKKYFCIILFCLVALAGCTTDGIFATIDGVYQGAKAVLTTPAVKSKIPQDKWGHLADADRVYLKAADEIKEIRKTKPIPME